MHLLYTQRLVAFGPVLLVFRCGEELQTEGDGYQTGSKTQVKSSVSSEIVLPTPNTLPSVTQSYQGNTNV